YGEINLGQGREQVKNFFRENPEIAREIEKKIREKAGIPTDELIADYIFDQRKNIVIKEQEEAQQAEKREKKTKKSKESE
ncbi:MAG: recombinase RecA, partial [Candidatus Calescibacterium sp.]